MICARQVMASQRVSIDPKNLNIPTMNYAGILQDYGYSPTDSEWLAAALIRQGGYRLRTPYYGAARSLFSNGYGGLNRGIYTYAKSMIVRQAIKDDSVKAVYDFIDSLHEMKRERSETIKALIGDNSMADYIMNDFHHVDPDAPTYPRMVTMAMDAWIDSLPIETLTHGAQTQFSTLSEIHAPISQRLLSFRPLLAVETNYERELKRMVSMHDQNGGEGEYHEAYNAEMVKDYQWVLDFVRGMTDEQHDMLNQFNIWGNRMGLINSPDLDKQFYAHFFDADLDTNNTPNRQKVHGAMRFLNNSSWFVERRTKGQSTKKSIMAGESTPSQIETQARLMLQGGLGLWWHDMMAISYFHQNNPDVKCIRSTPNNIMYYPIDIRAVKERLGRNGNLQLAHIQPIMGWNDLRDFGRVYMKSLCDEALRLRDIGLAKQKVVVMDTNKATRLAINESMDALRQIYENLPVGIYLQADGVEQTGKTMTTVDYSGRVLLDLKGATNWLHITVGHLTNYLGALAAWDGVRTPYPRLPPMVSKNTMGYARGLNPQQYGYEETQHEGLAWSMAEFGEAMTSLLFEGWEATPNTPFDFTPRIKTAWAILTDENAAFLRPIMVSVNDSMMELQKREAINVQKATIEQAQTQFIQSWEESETQFTANSTLLGLV